MNNYGASLYGYGHTHASSEQFFSQNMTDGVFYFNVSALGKDSPNQYTVTAIDCNGISSVTQNVGAWPVVLITAPMNRRLGGIVNPYAYDVTNGASNPIRALVFDPTAVTQVQLPGKRGSLAADDGRVRESPPLAGGMECVGPARGRVHAGCPGHDGFRDSDGYGDYLRDVPGRSAQGRRY